ncbi:MAG: hypothetical protein JW974_03440 [Alphaproteobacteria bacterium]|nr:hypothetical protein [Alphaproteobacteria bacterium]MBN2675292.1 hypothetical protein [Alphaproteobacteria bacterium]
MIFLKRLVGFVAVLTVVPTVFAATARPSIITTASSRMPTMTTQISGNTSSSTTTTVTLLVDTECIEAYTDCVKGADVCGPNFEECTNKTLFYGKKPQCASTLMQCKTSGVLSLFGTSNQTYFSNKNSAGEYVYPTNGSVLGQLIEAAYVNNRYDTSTCVKRYTSCLKKNDICGSDFELCTSNTEFRTQKIFCESTLARCQDDGKTELFGSTNTAASPAADSRLGVMISEGAALAAVNAVATCYKVIDQCMLQACSKNPYECKEGASHTLVDAAGNTFVDDPTTTTTPYITDNGAVNRTEIAGFIKNACYDTIGANKFCYATFIGNGAMPTNAQLQDEDNKDTIYSDAYSSRMNDSMKSKIDDLIEIFDTKTKQKCQNTITSCAMRSCGGGSGAACYASAFNSANTIKGVTNPATLADIKYGCEAVVNNDTYCKYSVATFETATGIIGFLSGSLFDILFTAADDTSVTNPDAVGAVATLNSKLSLSYNQASLDNMKKQCQTIATGCVKSMCGTDYTNCYRNRTDVYSTLTNTGDNSFDKSMNKVGGVLDHTIILGLCLNTIKNNPVCEEHIKAEAARRTASVSTADSWGAGINSTRDGWLGAGTYGATLTGDTVQDVDADGNLLCTTGADSTGDTGRCDSSSGRYIYPKMISESAYNIAQTERSVFNDLVYDLEVEAQANYNAKLTKQQNMCMSNNSGGIIGSRENGSTFMWVKLKNSKVPTNYAMNGLQNNQFVASNDIYGSFCRIRVTLQSDDKYIQDAINDGRDWSTAYFAAGDTFTCGSWISGDELETISNVVGGKAKSEATSGDSRTRTWLTLAGTVLGGVGGGVATNALQKGSLGGLLGTKRTDTNTTDANRCKTLAKLYQDEKDGVAAKATGESAIATAESLGVKEDLTAPIKRSVQKAGTVTSPANPEADAVNKQSANNAMDSLKTLCESELTSAKGSNTKTKTTLLGAGVGAVAGGALTYFATRDIQDAQGDNAATKARQEWMDEVGKHIRCYIGADEVGMYGDIISTEME